MPIPFQVYLFAMLLPRALSVCSCTDLECFGAPETWGRCERLTRKIRENLLALAILEVPLETKMAAFDMMRRSDTSRE
jgi:hypothetical protein